MEVGEADFKLCEESLCQSEFSDSDSDSDPDIDLGGMVPNVLSQSVSMPAELQLTFPIPNSANVDPAIDLGQQIMLVSSDGNKQITNEFGEPSAKRLCIEQDGQTFILTGLSINPNVTQSLMPANELISSQLAGESSKETDINQAWFTSREDKTTLQRKGHLWKQGMWSKEEIDLLQDNIQFYCQEHDITDPATVIFQMSKDERKDFYRTVAKGLNRPLFSVYRRVIRMYDNKNHIGKYTDEELEQLKELRSIHGNDWQAIGAAMGRSASSIKDRCRLLKENCNQGKWLPTEERQLAEAVYDLAKVVPGEMISSGLSWSAVAERVGTRSEKQCRTKWLNFLNWKEAGGTLWSREDDIALICKVCSLNVTEETLIDWNEMSKNWTSVRSPQWLRGKFWALKRHCPKEALDSFSDMCDYLYKHYARVCIKDEKSDGNLVSAVTLVQEKPISNCTSTIVSVPTRPALTTPTHMCDYLYKHYARVCVKDEKSDGNLVTLVQQEKPISTCTPTIVSVPTRPIITRPALPTPSHFVNSIGAPLNPATPTNPVVGDLSSLLGSTVALGMTPTVIQTVGVVPQSLQPNPNALTPEQAFLLTHTGQTTLPMTATVGPGQIIIQTVGDNLQMTEAMGLQLHANPQIILGSLVSTPGCPDSLVMPLNTNSGSISLDDDKDDDLDDEDDCDHAYSDESFQHVETYDDDDASHIESDFVDDKGNRLIVSDVMLAASGSSSDIDKDSLDNVASPSSS